MHFSLFYSRDQRFYDTSCDNSFCRSCTAPKYIGNFYTTQYLLASSFCKYRHKIADGYPQWGVKCRWNMNTCPIGCEVQLG